MEDIDPQVVRVDLDVDIVIHFGHDFHQSKGRVPTMGGVEGRQAHQAMNTPFGLQIAIGVAPFHANDDILDSCFFPQRQVEDFGLESSALGPMQVHTLENLGPVLGVDPPRA